jgi:hypothetical protein
MPKETTSQRAYWEAKSDFEFGRGNRAEDWGFYSEAWDAYQESWAECVAVAREQLDIALQTTVY